MSAAWSGKIPGLGLCVLVYHSKPPGSAQGVRVAGGIRLRNKIDLF